MHFKCISGQVFTCPLVFVSINEHKMIAGSLFKIKKGLKKEWIDWCAEIQNIRRSEAIETLKEEKVIQEAFVFFEVDDVEYTLGISEGENLPANNERDINKIHKEKKKKCLEYIGKVDTLYHLKSKDE